LLEDYYLCVSLFEHWFIWQFIWKRKIEESTTIEEKNAQSSGKRHPNHPKSKKKLNKMAPNQAFIVACARTAAGRNRGRISHVHPADLGAVVVNSLLDRVPNQFDPGNRITDY
jgi:hypothetical protein